MTTTHTAPYAVLPASPLLGGEIIGVDLANGVDEASPSATRRLLEFRLEVVVIPVSDVDRAKSGPHDEIAPL